MSLLTWIDPHFTDVQINVSLVRALKQYRLQYLMSSPGHMAFYGEGLIGTHHIWFKSVFENRLFNQILLIDRQAMERELRKVGPDKYSLAVPEVMPSRKVTGDVFNLVCMYLAYRIYNSALSPADKTDGVRTALSLYCYRTLAAIHSNSFTYLGSEDIARATYNALSNKFIIKQLKTWEAYIEYRVDGMIANSNDRGKALQTLKSDKDVLFILSNTSNAFRSTFKVMYGMYLTIKDSQSQAISSSLQKKVGDEVINADLINVESLSQAASLALADGSIRDSTITKLCINIVPRISMVELNQAVTAMTKRYLANQRQYDTWVRRVVAYTKEVIRTADTESIKDIGMMVRHVYNAFGSSKNSTTILSQVREVGLDIARDISSRNNQQYIVRIRSAIIIYIAVWAITH